MTFKAAGLWLPVLVMALGCAACGSRAVAPAGGSATAPAQFNADFVKLTVPVQRVVTDVIPITGKLALDKQRTRIASARVAGRLGRIFVFEGQSVVTGQPLAEIYSPEFISAQNEYLLARRFRDTLASGAVDVELHGDAESTLQSAGNKLRVLGATAGDIQELERRGAASEYLQLRAPISGVVTARNLDPGAYLNVGDALMSLANMDILWLVANTYDTDYAALKLGQSLEFHTSSLPGETFNGRVAFIAPSIDPTTHTLPIRCDVPNAGMRLRPEMFITGSLEVGTRSATIVPRSAVIHIRDSDYVIVKDPQKGFQRVAIRGRAISTDEYVIVQGWPAPGTGAGSPIVSDGGLLLNESLSKD